MVELTREEREYRRLGAERAMDVAAAAGPARDALLAAVAARRMEPFPATDPMGPGREAVAGRVVVLPPTRPSAWVHDFGERGALVAGDATRGRYFLNTRDGGMALARAALERYEAKVGHQLGDEPHEVVAEVTGKPRIVVVDGNAEVGLDVDALGVAVGDWVFVDVTRASGGVAAFAGEDALVEVPRVSAGDGRDPGLVIAAWFSAACCGDERGWAEHVCTWEFKEEQGALISYPARADHEPRLAAGWRRWRGWALERIYGVRPRTVWEPTTIVAAGMTWEGAPIYERVSVDVIYVDVVDGEPRAVEPHGLPGTIVLQRKNAGPWLVVVP